MMGARIPEAASKKRGRPKKAGGESGGNGISEADSKNAKWDWREQIAGMADDKLADIATRGNPEPAAAARAILEEREAASKKRRGRPKVMDKIFAKLAKDISPDVKTTRGLQNVHYRQRAFICLGLGDDARFKWLCDSEAMMKDGPNAWKPGILAELGRFNDDEELRAYAEAICEQKPKTKDAIVRLRRARLGNGARPNCTALTQQIARLVDAYRVAHPDATKRQILQAIENVYDAAEETLPDDVDASRILEGNK